MAKTVASQKYTPLHQVRSVEDLYHFPLAYERLAFMQHIGQFDREELRNHYLGQPMLGAEVWANYVVNLWEYEHGVEELTSHPWNITIPITEVCNARCSFCSSPLVPDPKATMAHEIQHFAEALRYAVRVSLQGLGEPLAHPQFETIVAEVRKYTNPIARLEMITNGWLLSGRRWDLLKSIRIGDLQVSVNAATDRTHQIAMGAAPGTFDQVVKNIESVLADPDWRSPNDSGMPGIRRVLKLSMVITRHSLPEVTRFLDMFARRGVDFFQLNALLPLTTPDWGFGRTDQYLDLWCGNLPNARELVDQAKKVITKYRRAGVTITATPEQWLMPVDQWRRANPGQLPVAQREAAVIQQSGLSPTRRPGYRLGTLFVLAEGKKVFLTPHQVHTEVLKSDAQGVEFRGTAQSGQWAYLFRTSPFTLSEDRCVLNLRADLASGKLVAGILDAEHDDFVAQAELHPGTTEMEFSLPKDTAVELILRQGDDDTPVAATFCSAQIAKSTKPPSPEMVVEGGTVRFVPHDLHTELVQGDAAGGIDFRGTGDARPWAYLLRSPSLRLSQGRYRVDLDVVIASGHIYGGVLDVQANEFLVQQELVSGPNTIEFALPDGKVVDIILRQGADPGTVVARYRAGQFSAVSGVVSIAPIPGRETTPRSEPEGPATTPKEWAGAASPPAASEDASLTAPRFEEAAASRPAVGINSEKRIFCPMVYNTLSVFHHSLDVSICCYMENAPGHKRPNLKKQSLSETYNDPAFKLVRRTLTTDKHIPVCDTCPYGNFRS